MRQCATLPLLSESPGRCLLATPAKINLFLELLGRQSDGYHAIETLMLTINLYDTLEFRLRDDGRIMLHCDHPQLPSGPGNLSYRAAAALQSVSGCRFGVDLRLTKRIPHQAGLGGGSSDAAATLFALNRLWRLNWPRQELQTIAASLGSDISFFLSPPAAWCTGRGERVEPEQPGARFDFVVVKPSLGLSTAEVYQRATVPSRGISGLSAREALRAGDPVRLAQGLHNRLQEAAFAAAPAVREVYTRLQETKPLGCLLSGSGSCVFALCRNRADAARVAREYARNAATLDPELRILTVRSMR